ncbi:hypothetical protein ACFYUK_28225 [Nonomuraea wenchangensis]
MTIGYANATGTWTTVSLRAGYNMIRLAKGSPHFARGAGYAGLDYTRLI